ncbi:MAG: c-type cytochrome [Proteobacteria bacterium]|nr:c-type cytochrome [Pseudomonadota bacterium]
MKKLLLCLMLPLALAGCGDKKGSPVKGPMGDVEAGKLIAEKNCKGCHGMDGGGAAPGIPHLAAQREAYLQASIVEYKEGKRTHAALKDMTAHMNEAEVRNVVAFYASLPPVPVAPAKDVQHSSPYQEGKALAESCAKCHGEDGNSKVPGTPSLAGQQPHYLVTAIEEYHQGERKSAPMTSQPGSNKMNLEQLAWYYASQTPAQRTAPSFGDPVAGEPATAMCGGCHGSKGVSTDASTPTLAGQDARYLVNSMNAYKKNRQNWGMQRYIAGLTEKDIENIAAYYSIQKSQPADAVPSSVKELTDKCNRCHDASNNPAMVVPKMNGQDRDYLVMSLRAYRDGKRQSSMMHNMSFAYSNAMIESIATWYSTQPPDKH